MRKRILSGLTVLAMVFSLLPQTISFANPSDLGLLWPVKGYYHINSGFGWRASMNSAHNGIDINVPANETIYAAQGGVVVQATYHSSWGNYVKIKHNGTYHTLYAHMTKYIVAAGDYVQRGQPIGYVGSTGAATGPHLHFEIYENGTRINPLPVNVDGRHSYGGSAPLVQAVYYSYDDGIYGNRNEEPAHVHSWSYDFDAAHPHKQYRYCSGCGAKEYTGKSQQPASCKSCFPVGNIKLTRSFDKVKGTAVFYRNNVSNAHSYSLTVYKNGSEYNTYNMSSTSKSVSGLSSGNYTAKLTVKNTNTGETKTVSASSFNIVDTYTVSYNANGGSGAPSSQTKIQDTNLTLSSTIPKKTGHIFKGWASSKTAKDAQYSASGTYTKNAKITLYAVWEPETYIIKFDANGGKGELADTTITYGNTLRMPNSVVKDGFYLKGWSTNKNATNADYRANMDYKLTANTQLYAVWGSSTWGGTVATEFAGGDGTEENPYQISNAGELAYLAKIVNSQTSVPEYKYYILTDNISLGYEEWMPIGISDNENQYFNGSFDGNGFTISDLSISQPNSGYIGIFGYTNDSEIKNITVTGDITGISSSLQLYIGSIAGYSNHLNAENCNGAYINISDISTTATGSNQIGALFGTAFVDSSIKKCTANECYISVKDGLYILGTIVGYSRGQLIGCETKAEGELFGSTTNTQELLCGGIADASTGSVKECKVNAGFLSNNLRSSSGRLFYGGISGWLNGTIELCSVNFNNGLERSIDGNTYQTSMMGSSTGTSSFASAGGIVGYAKPNAKIKDCKYNGSSISATSSNSPSYAGGIVGFQAGSTTEKITAQGGMPLNRDALPKRDGYKATWYTDSDFKNKYDFTQEVASDTTLYAKWEEGDDILDIWDGTSEEPLYNNETKTYTISNAKELAWISDVSNGIIKSGENFPADITFEGYTIELVNDIYLNDATDYTSWTTTTAHNNQWKSIKSLNGVINGRNHKIVGMYGCGSEGFVSIISTSGEVSNIRFKQGYLNGNTIGLVSAYNNGKINNCHNESVVVDGSNAGGIAGKTSGYINWCSNNAAVYSDWYGGGIASLLYDTNGGNLFYSYNTGTIYASGQYAGGIVGLSLADNNACDIFYCYNSGNVTYKQGATWSNRVKGAGGIVGRVSNQTDVQYSYNTGNLFSNSIASGIVGDLWNSSNATSNIVHCYTTGNTSSTNYAGFAYMSGGGGTLNITSSYAPSDKVYTNKASGASTNTQISRVGSVSSMSSSYYTQGKLNTLSKYDKTYTITIIEDVEESIAINRVFANVNGIIYGQSAQNAQVGGIIGHVGSSGVETAPAKNMLAISDRVSAVSSGSSYYAKAGDIVGEMSNNAFDFSDVYSYSSMDLSAVNSAKAANASTSSISSARTLAQIKRATFLRNVFGEPYQSLEYLKAHPDAVWVQKDGELPELYFNVLNDITVSDTENGTITVDRAQAVDDEIVNVTATPAEGYELNKVYVNGKEIDGTTFAVNSYSDVFATFIEKTPEFSVEIETDANATASLTNVDEADVQLSSVGEFTLFADEPVTELTASDGEEIKVTAAADEDYTVDAIYVNGEEIAGDSFILTDDTKVTLEVTSISTDTKAVTNDSDNVGSYFAMLSGSVESDTEGVSRYIRYWEKDNPDEVFTTEVEDGAGEYSAELMPLVADTTYQYQMTEYGEIKEFTTLHQDEAEYYDDGLDDDPTEEPVIYDYPVFEIKNPQISADTLLLDIQNNADDEATGVLIIATYNSSDELLTVTSEDIENIPKDTSKSYEIAVPEAIYYRLFIWKDIKSMLPLADFITVR